MSPFPYSRASADGDQREASGQLVFVRAAPGCAKAMFQIFGQPESMPHNHARQISVGFFSFVFWVCFGHKYSQPRLFSAHIMFRSPTELTEKNDS